MSWLFVSGGQNVEASASVSALPMNIQGLYFRIDCFDLFAVQGTLMSLLQYYSSKESIIQRSAFFMVQLSHPYMTTEKPSTGKCILDGDGGGDQLDNVSTLNS